MCIELIEFSFYIPESSGLTYFMFKATYPKSCIVVTRFAL